MGKYFLDCFVSQWRVSHVSEVSDFSNNFYRAKEGTSSNVGAGSVDRRELFD